MREGHTTCEHISAETQRLAVAAVELAVVTGLGLHQADAPAFGGEVGAVEAVQVGQCKPGAGAAGAVCGQQAVAADAGADFLVSQQEPRLEHTVAAQVQAQAGVDFAELGVKAALRLAGLVQVHGLAAQQAAGFGKPGLAGLQRLVPVDTQQVVCAQLAGEQQLAAAAVELRHLVGQPDVVACIVTRAPGEVQAAAQEVRAPGFFGRVKPKNVFVIAACQLVGQVAVAAFAVGEQQVLLQCLDVQR